MLRINLYGPASLAGGRRRGGWRALPGSGGGAPGAGTSLAVAPARRLGDGAKIESAHISQYSYTIHARLSPASPDEYLCDKIQGNIQGLVRVFPTASLLLNEEFDSAALPQRPISDSIRSYRPPHRVTAPLRKQIGDS